MIRDEAGGGCIRLGRPGKRVGPRSLILEPRCYLSAGVKEPNAWRKPN